MSDLVEYSRQGAIVHIVLNRPQKLNALTTEMIRQLRAALDRFDHDENAEICILSGAGKAFCAGADVHDRHTTSTTSRRFPNHMPVEERNWDLLVNCVN